VLCPFRGHDRSMLIYVPAIANLRMKPAERPAAAANNRGAGLERRPPEWVPESRSAGILRSIEGARRRLKMGQQNAGSGRAGLLPRSIMMSTWNHAVWVGNRRHFEMMWRRQ